MQTFIKHTSNDRDSMQEFYLAVFLWCCLYSEVDEQDVALRLTCYPYM